MCKSYWSWLHRAVEATPSSHCGPPLPNLEPMSQGMRGAEPSGAEHTTDPTRTALALGSPRIDGSALFRRILYGCVLCVGVGAQHQLMLRGAQHVQQVHIQILKITLCLECSDRYYQSIAKLIWSPPRMEFECQVKV